MKELRDWIVRRKENFSQLMAVRARSNHQTETLLELVKDPRSTRAQSQLPHLIRDTQTIANRSDVCIASVTPLYHLLISRVQELDNENKGESVRAAYLIETLKHRGFTWPDLASDYIPDKDVCSFLGTVDLSFDARAELTILEDKEHEDMLLAKCAELAEKSKPLQEQATRRRAEEAYSPESTIANLKTKARAAARKMAKAKAREAAGGDASKEATKEDGSEWEDLPDLE